MAHLRYTPFSFRPGTSPLHRLHPVAKLAGFLALSLACALGAVPVLAAAVVVIVSLACIARLHPGALLSGWRVILLISAFSVLGRTLRFTAPWFDSAALPDAFLLAARLCLCFLAGSLYFAVSSSAETFRAIEDLETRISPTERPPVIALAICMMLNFIPRIAETWETASAACRARSGKRGFARLALVAPLVIEIMIEKAGDTALAMKARAAMLPRK
jgi:biotin transport system permease protein